MRDMNSHGAILLRLYAGVGIAASILIGLPRREKFIFLFVLAILIPFLFLYAIMFRKYSKGFHTKKRTVIRRDLGPALAFCMISGAAAVAGFFSPTFAEIRASSIVAFLVGSSTIILGILIAKRSNSVNGSNSGK